MKMKNYVVTMQVTGKIDVEVKAPSFKIAIEKANFLLPQMDWNKLEATKCRAIDAKKQKGE